MFFEKHYEIQTLQELEEYIIEKGYLPEIPIETEVAKNGISVGKMNARLLQKIEELALLLIQE